MPREEQVNGDRGFSGMNDRIDPASLPPGTVVDAENVHFRYGVAETRPGVHKPAALNNLSPELSDEINPWGTIHGIGTFLDQETGLEQVIIAADGKCYYARQGVHNIEIPLPDDLTLDDDVTFTQAFGKMLMHRGKFLKPLVLTDLDTGFEDVVAVYDDTATYAAAARVCHGPLQSPVSSGMTYSSPLVSVEFASGHGYRTGQEVFIAGADQAEYNGRWKISETDEDDIFTFTPTTAPSVTPATGTITVSTHFDFYEAKVSPDTPSAGEDPINDASKWTQVYDAMPNSASGVYIQNRLAIPTAYNTATGAYDQRVDAVQFSDVLDITKTHWDQGFDVARGGVDELVDIHVISENQLAAFKENSVHVFTGVKVESANTTFATGVVLETLISGYGLAAPRAVATAGDDIYFFSAKRGVVSFKRNLQGKMQGVDVPLSEPIQKLIDRIDSRYYSSVRIAYHDNLLYTAVPLDGGDSGANNCLLCYDFLSQSWSYYTGSAIRPREFFKAQWSGTERLFYFGDDGFVNLLGEGWSTDDIRDTDEATNIGGEDIAYSLTTRGYANQDKDHRLYQNIRVTMSTWNPQYDIAFLPDGVNEGVAIATDRSKDRTAYYRPFDAAPFDELTDTDFDAPYREDYSARVGDSSGSYLGMTLGDGFYPFRHQEIMETFALPPRAGRYGQIKITGDQGRLELRELNLTSAGGDRSAAVHT